MKYTDLIAHLNKIQEAMWKTIPGKVSLFIGAGFSRNSNPIDAGNKSFPEWKELSTAMIEELYPNGSISDKEKEKLKNKAEVPAQILRFAQEYKELFGQARLDDLLKQNIPDDKYEPNELYSRLLELPWKDIFTTNYDTLLERATEKVFERDYRIITKVHDLAGSCSPRIIKLHGTFPNTTPFIITEEEFRTYSDVYKPFVNTVRQSLIENIFVLIGFSGDDPNFQSWIGWVRDNMHDYTQKIYICTLGNFNEYTEAQKRLLINKNIELIDLSVLFNEKSTGLITVEPNYPDAFKWLFEYLKQNRKVNPHEWPGESELSMPVYIPLESPDRYKQQHIQNIKISDELDKHLINIRKTYPGWIITPEKTRNLLEHNIHNRHLNDIIDGCKNDSMIIRMLVNYIWMKRLQYLSLYIYELEIIDSYLKSLREDKERLILVLSDTSTLDNYTELLLYLISDARENKEQERVDLYFKILSENISKVQTLKQHYFYEKIMCEVYELNIKKIYDQLSSWQPEIKYPLFYLIKASLLCEFGKTKEASKLLSSMLESIRRNREDIISNKAIEGICLYLLDLISIMDYRNRDDRLYKKEMERLYTLDMDKCNPYSEISRLQLNIFRAAIPVKPVVERKKLFDPFSYTTVRRFSGNSASNHAGRIINFYDYMPVPMNCDNVITIDKEQVLIAVNTFKYKQPLFAIPFLLRYRSVELIDQVIARFYIGSIDQKVFDYLFETYYQSLIDNIDYVNSNQYGNVVLSIIACQIELLSRLIFRLNEEQYDSVILLLKKTYSSSKILNNWRYSEQKKNLVNRLLEHRCFFLGKKFEVYQFLLNLPIPDIQVLKGGRYKYPEPWDELANDSLSLFNEIIIPGENIKRLLNYALDTDEAIRSFAIGRLYFYYEINKMTQDDVEEFKNNLWRMTDEYGLPKNIGLRTWVVLNMPHTEGVDIKSNVKKYLMDIDFKRYMMTSQSIGGRNELIEKIDNIIDSTKNVFRYERKFNYIEFTDYELRGLLKNIILSWQSIKQGIDKNIHSARDEFFDDLKKNYESIANLITAVILPNLESVSLAEEEELYEMTMILEKNYIYVPQLLLLLNQKVNKSDLEDKFYTGLLAHDEEMAGASVEAITFWCHLRAGHEGITDVPHKLIDEFVDIIKNIRQPAFNILIERLNFLIIQVPAIFKSEQYEVIIQSLEKLEILTRLPDINRITDNQKTFTGFCPFEELPDYRTHLSKITATIYKDTKKGNINVRESYIDLLKDLGGIYSGDVFPEVVKPWIGILED